MSLQFFDLLCFHFLKFLDLLDVKVFEFLISLFSLRLKVLFELFVFLLSVDLDLVNPVDKLIKDVFNYYIKKRLQ